MQIKKVDQEGQTIAVVSGSEVVIDDVQSALDLLATASYETGCDRMIVHKALVSERFFDLKTRLAGEILQKFANYRMKLALVGDFSGYGSQSLRDFIYECNQGNDILFVQTEAEAIDKWCALA